MTSEKYRCRGCSWTCELTPNTQITKLPKTCPFTDMKLVTSERLAPMWERDCR